MIFEFIFSISKIKSHSADFVVILHQEAHKRGLLFTDKIENNDTSYSFFLKSDPKEALNFADSISKILPSSIHFNFIELKTPQNVDIKKWRKVCKKSDHFLDFLTITNITDKNSSKFCDVFKWVKNIHFLDKPINDASSLKRILQDIARKLKNGESIDIQTSRGFKRLSLNLKTPDLMFWDISNLFTYMRVDKIQAEILASFEKPVMRLSPKEVFASSLLETEENFELKVRLPFDLILALLGVFAIELEMGYVFLTDIKDSSMGLNYKHHKIPKEEEIVVSKDGIIINTNISRKSRSIFDIIDKHFQDQIQEETKTELPKTFSKKTTSPINHQKLILFLSKIHPTSILIKDDKGVKSLFPIEFDSNPKNILEAIKKNYESGDKLVQNFSQSFETTFSNINSLKNTPVSTHNLMDIFSSASFILGYMQDFNIKEEKILNNAKKFLRDKGPRIDFKLQKNDNGVYLDYPKILRSSMSFRIAGLDEATLSYGFIDSMAEFLGNFVRDVVMNFNVKNVLVCGDMLGEKIFLDRMLHYLPKNIDLILPQEGYIDYKN
ncbi:hypothetical protein BKH42_04350 [Helicobacter sp. 13S00482-2]|uniref:hypothetical protein n=1 Tax=Helicobacter sp. 13S00482-2 TaxID=1476200 RepID=UPI000BA7C9EE|nr:hypothetical protein [Helicobacter sp. 13S00482-2]PAF53734.1 hypothetical protein BKH42_04350 [Helicobacter sp. 13S00482-2]